MDTQTRKELIDDLMFNQDLHGYSREDLEQMQEYSLVTTYATYEDQFDECT